VLIETGFISNEDEEKWLSSEAGQLQICATITSAMSSFFGKDTPIRANLPEPVLASQENETRASQDKSEKVESPLAETQSEKEAFTIQLAAMKSKIDTKVMGGLAHLGDIKIVEENGYFKYQLGEFEEMAQQNRPNKK
jgi:N-acetylmuramoyl-L-alanine amidase